MDMGSEWDPLLADDNSSGKVVRCVYSQTLNLTRDPPEGIFAMIDEHRATIVHTLICGPRDTVYDGGFFYFLLRFPNDYPFSPPKV